MIDLVQIVLAGDDIERIALERMPALTQYVINNATERKDVHGDRLPLLAVDLRGKPPSHPCGVEVGPAEGRVQPRDLPSQPEVAELDRTGLGEEHVLRPHVPVDDVFGVEEAEGADELTDDPLEVTLVGQIRVFLGLEPPVLQQLPQAKRTLLDSQVQAASILFNAEVPNHVRMHLFPGYEEMNIPLLYGDLLHNLIPGLLHRLHRHCAPVFVPTTIHHRPKTPLPQYHRAIERKLPQHLGYCRPAPFLYVANPIAVFLQGGPAGSLLFRCLSSGYRSVQSHLRSF
mmetsp:Transcript_40832/g.55598  ORF Transcript_40832/g.55598 Transcript_40832/m.55598 type:complete len:286 (+) Transcript_40832:780-1637(+)|eukprot:CAMPEP_0185754206 /NCGR_PEP_ID=MMETSP1174-20130828/12847_1 /TAXON_ID=35687 /ORGANISM="Dictyocha speculum, Strain CCMP1381" /LENGTH=285 /DNA_ID=CAMNT_0028432317 /DNA_START=780 /DNA_END=1637 /DNA_ORIENTATION=-